MSWGDLLAAALWGVHARPSRSIALILALASAVAAVAFTASALGGFSATIERLAFGDYPRALIVRQNALVQDRTGPPSLDDRARLLAEFKGIESSAAWAYGVAPIRAAGNVTEQVQVFGALGDYRRELDAPLVAGRWLGESETAGLSRLCLVGPDAAEVFGRQNLVGREIRIAGRRCTVVGVLDYARSRPAARFNKAVIAPFGAARRYLIDDDEAGPRDASWLTFFFPRGTDMDEAAYLADRQLRRVHGVPLTRPSPFLYDDPAAPVREQAAQRDTLARLLWTVTGAALVASLIAYGAIAFATIAARRREIALRLAVGARPSTVQAQLTLEHVLIGAFACGIGLAVGFGAAVAASTTWGWPIRLDLAAAGGAVGSGLLLGLGLGLLAAREASRTSPALAARQ